jgi:hypothetical protein
MILHSFFNPNLFPGQYGSVEKDALSFPYWQFLNTGAKIHSSCIQFQVPGIYDGAQKFGYGGGLDESDMRFTSNKMMSKSTIFPDGNYLKAFTEKEKAAPVAKIKVVVCSLILSHTCW